jgi:hypothetical protein
VHNKIKPINLKAVVKKTEEQLNQDEDSLSALQWQVPQSVHNN